MKRVLNIRLSLLAVVVLALTACTPAATPSPMPPPTTSIPATRTAAPTATATAAATAAATQASPVATATLAPSATAAPSATDAPPTRTPTALPTATSSATSTPAAATMKVSIFVSGLDIPWAIDFAPDGRIFVTERPGRIRIIKDGKLQPEPWATLPVAAVGEGGLLGLALDPHFSQNGYVYVAYTYRSAQGTLLNRLARMHEDPATGKGALDKVLFDGVAANTYHNGGRVKFGPDGKLYWTMGDAENPSSAQDPKLPNGKILRFNPDGSIPADNPFPGYPTYSYGHRNPQGLAWQPGADRLYATEHGPSGAPPNCCQDEVNYIEPGKNYGWPLITGDQTRAGLVTPIINSGTNTTWAPSGATFVTQGPWQGALVFAGLRGQSLYRLTLDPNDPRKVVRFESYLQGQFGRLRDVVQGPDGALYILTSNGDGRGTMPPDGDRVLRLTFGP